jgi:uncharacterized protein YkwD
MRPAPDLTSQGLCQSGVLIAEPRVVRSCVLGAILAPFVVSAAPYSIRYAAANENFVPAVGPHNGLGQSPCLVAAVADPQPTVAARAPSPTGITSAIVNLTNAKRRNGGLANLRASTSLMQAAQLQADQMASLRRLEHVLPDAPYPAPADRLAAAGYAWRAYGENLASGRRSASETVTGWVNSPRHRANMMNRTFTEIGVGYATDSTGRPYYVQVFGTPR